MTKSKNLSWCVDCTQDQDITTIYILNELTQWVHVCVIPTPDFNPIHVSAFVYCCGYYGQPDVIYFDNSTLLSRLAMTCEENKIKHRLISAYSPQKKGKLERAISMLHNCRKPGKMPKKVMLKVDAGKGTASIINEEKDPFRAAFLDLYVEIQADIESNKLFNGQSCYAAEILDKIMDKCSAIDPDLFPERRNHEQK